MFLALHTIILLLHVHGYCLCRIANPRANTGPAHVSLRCSSAAASPRALVIQSIRKESFAETLPKSRDSILCRQLSPLLVLTVGLSPVLPVINSATTPQAKMLPDLNAQFGAAEERAQAAAAQLAVDLDATTKASKVRDERT